MSAIIKDNLEKRLWVCILSWHTNYFWIQCCGHSVLWYQENIKWALGQKLWSRQHKDSWTGDRIWSRDVAQRGKHGKQRTARACWNRAKVLLLSLRLSFQVHWSGGHRWYQKTQILCLFNNCHLEHKAHNSAGSFFHPTLPIKNWKTVDNNIFCNNSFIALYS